MSSSFPLKFLNSCSLNHFFLRIVRPKKLVTAKELSGTSDVTDKSEIILEMLTYAD